MGYTNELINASAYLYCAGSERRLCYADLTHLKTMASQASVTEAVINYTPIENIQVI